MNTESKFFIGIGLVTLVVIVAGVFFLGRKSTSSQPVINEQKVLGTSIRNFQGNPNAPVKIVEFADFQCPACGVAHPIVKNIIEKNQDKVYFVYRHYPLSSHRNAKLAAQASEAAGVQEKFWQMYDMIFENQKEWSDSSNAKEIFETYAQKLGLDVTKFKEDFDKTKSVIEQDYADGNQVGVDSTPTFFINGQKNAGVIQQSQFQDIIDQASISK